MAAGSSRRQLTPTLGRLRHRHRLNDYSGSPRPSASTTDRTHHANPPPEYVPPTCRSKVAGFPPRTGRNPPRPPPIAGWQSRSSSWRRRCGIFDRGRIEITRLQGKLRELRFHLTRQSVRITYWIAPGRRIILLTVFRKQRMREQAEVRRAARAMQRCVDEQHTVEEVRES
ncbi:type II toxin-antitoxin system RelE/ParE family toxin [Nocardia fluminea]|uniref:type II toxin-antitoxin system RelE/ParE family toxin n=1 Tax=Nocardia fluminea TaxID=134984 RepID=UPI000C713AC3|nr:type II toxin-antitoxin system RelE/ParE family toxin [Nocardia fluminea]